MQTGVFAGGPGSHARLRHRQQLRFAPTAFACRTEVTIDAALHGEQPFIDPWRPARPSHGWALMIAG
jgi:hypothetical protein